MKTRALFTLLASACSCLAAAPAVHLCETNLVLPTYLAAPPSPVPRFYEGRTYQGARATFYPYPVQDVLTDVKSNVTYKALFLENQYLQISVLPDLGGRIFSATDKGNGYDFFYRQHVIKPALIGMLGAWISGGVEWNVPHHHRATSFMPVDCTATTNTDGSATIWVGEIELRHRLKWLVGMTLYPDRSYLELTCKVFNRTPFSHPMLFWINPAVHANTNYQVLFPPGTEWTAQHAKPEFASWPVARQVYGGTDYTRGVDISWWKNHPSPVSFFAWNYADDWFGGYDHGRQAGVVHWADHHVAPGKKFFEWGNGPEGEMWSKILTDEDGPYLELMAGAWSDNQPDYSWIQPGETREWQHWWYPIRNLGGVKAATRDAAVNLEVTNRTAKIAVNATKAFKGAKVRLAIGSTGNLPVPSGDSPDGTGERVNKQSASAETRTVTAVPLGESPSGTGRLPVPPRGIYERAVDIGPAKPLSTVVMIENELAADQLRLSVLDADGKELVAYQPAISKGTAMPKPAERPKPPKDYSTTDELYFTGQRIEQLYSPSFEAAPYYEEILRRDPGDYRANTALGILLSRQGRWTEAEKPLHAAIERATANYIRPGDGEALYYLGVVLKAQGRWEEAFATFNRASWSEAWRAAANQAMVEIHCLRREFRQARARLADSPLAGTLNLRAACWRAAMSRHLDDRRDAMIWANLAHERDPLDALAWNELALERRMGETDEPYRRTLAELGQVMRRDVPAHLELAVEYENLGLWNEAIEVLQRVVNPRYSDAKLLPLYHLAYCVEKAGRAEEAVGLYDKAARATSDLCFPHRFEEESILRRAMEVNASDANAAYLLGCLLYDNQPENAIKAWEESRRRAGQFALTHRNLALAYAQHEKNVPKAIASLEKAVELDPKEPRFFYELDVQYEAGGAPVARRLVMLTDHHAVVAERDDALTREIVLLTVAGQADRALELLRGRHFRNWEGSSQIHSVYVDACLAHGQHLFAEKKYREALREYEAALEYPENLEVGRARRAPRTAQIQYHIGAAHEGLGGAAQAKAAFEKAVAGRDRSPSESQYFHALALQKLGRADEAKPIFERLVKAGQEQLIKGEAADYFAKFGEKQGERVRKANACYLKGLGHLGLGQPSEARTEFRQALEEHPGHLGANSQLAMRDK